MAEGSNIEWCDHTFNPWEGCQKAGPGCDGCYAEARNARFGGGTAPNWGPGAPRRRTSEANWKKPLKWNRDAKAFFAKHGRRQRVFCASLADVFDNAVDPVWRSDLFGLIDATPDLDWLLLTKRIGNVYEQTRGVSAWPNVWLGITIVNQAEAWRDIPKLLATPAAKRFLSCEPLLGQLHLNDFGLRSECNHEGGYTEWDTNALVCNECEEETLLDWVIVGGESGPKARPMHPDWARSLREQCAAAGVPFLFKQWGEFGPDTGPDTDFDSAGIRRDRVMEGAGPCAVLVDGDWQYFRDGYEPPIQLCEAPGEFVYRFGKKRAGRLLDGVLHNAVPA